MKNTVKFLFAGMFFMFLFGSSFAQTVSNDTVQKLTVEQRTTKALAEMTTIATLSAEQVEKITPFVTQFFTQKDTDDQEYAVNQKTELKVLATRKRREALVNNLSTVLTAEQIELLKQNWESMNTKKKVSTQTQPVQETQPTSK